MPQVQRAKATLKEFLPVFPGGATLRGSSSDPWVGVVPQKPFSLCVSRVGADIIASVKTEIAARYTLHQYRTLLEHNFECGSLNAKGRSVRPVTIERALQDPACPSMWRHSFRVIPFLSVPPTEYETCVKECDNSMVKLYDHNHSERAPPRLTILANLGFLRFLEAEELEALFVGSKALCQDVFFRYARPSLPTPGALS